MNKNLTHNLPWFISIMLHVALACLFINLVERPQNTYWSGGRGDVPGLLYLNITATNESVGARRAVSSSVSLPTSRARHTVPLQVKPKIITHSGIGNSDTPAGGRGNGLDRDGEISNTAPSLIALIRKKIAAHKIYPLAATKQNLAGTVKVGFQINPDGSLRFVKVATSSGHVILDDAAIKTVLQAAPLPYFSTALELPIEYDTPDL